MNDERRKYSRTNIVLPIEVQSYACEYGNFYERTETNTLSPLGASFRLGHRVEIDDILRLTLAMPLPLRLYDQDQPQYLIYGQIRRIRPRSDGCWNIGVAFISKDPPDIDLATDEVPIPQQQFVTRPLANEILANVSMPSPSKGEGSPSLKHPTIAQKFQLNSDRLEPRAKLRLSLSIRGVDKNGQYFVEVIQTEDVSKHGLCFALCKHELEAKSIIEIVGFQGKFSAQGEVRHAQYNTSDKTYRIGVRLLGDPGNWIVK